MMATEQGTSALVSQFADEIIKRLQPKYDLVYVDQRDELSDSQVAALVRGDEWIDESWEWESDQRYESAKYIIDDLASDVIREWDAETDADLAFVVDAFKHDAEEWDRVRFEIEERDTGNWVEQLIRTSPRVLLRVNVLDEDHAYSYEDVKPRRVLKDIGMPATRANVETVDRTLAECSPEFSVLLGYWIVGADLDDIYELPMPDLTDHEHCVEMGRCWQDRDPCPALEGNIEIVNPYLYLGNPFSGSGFISERPIEGVVTVKREDLRTDKDAFGYPVDEIYGGLRASDFEATIRPVNKEAA